MVSQVSETDLPSLFGPNLMRTLVNQSKKEDRFLHSAALSALQSIQARVEEEPTFSVPMFVALSSKHGIIDFDKITKTKTLETIMLCADDSSLRKIMRHLNSLILRPETEEQAIADSRRQVIADLLLNLVKHYKRYASFSDDTIEQDGWLRKNLEVFVEYAYFVPSQSAKTSKVPLPPLGEKVQQIFQERLSSCLTKLLSLNIESRSAFAMAIVGMIQSKSASSKSLSLAFKADRAVAEILKNASQTLDAISAKVNSLWILMRSD